MRLHLTAAKPERFRLVLIAFSFGTLAQGVPTFNGGFDAGEEGWLFSGGATVVATGEPNDNPFDRVPDGPLVFLYQKMSSAAAQFTLSFDFFTEARIACARRGTTLAGCYAGDGSFELVAPPGTGAVPLTDDLGEARPR